MLLGEWLKDNIEFSQIIIDKVNPDNLVDLSSLDVDLRLKIGYGNYSLYEPISKLSDVELSQYVLGVYLDKWLRVIDYTTEPYEIGESSSTRIKSSMESTGTSENTNQSLNKVSAYNEGLVDDTNQEIIGSDSKSNLDVTDKTESKHSYYTARTQISYLASENILRIIVEDIINEVVIQIK